MRHYALLTCLLLPLESIAVPLTWGDGNGHAYEVVLASNISWSAAQAAATARGGRLATIGSSAENEFVFALTFISNEALRPLTTGIYGFVGRYDIQWQYLMAASILSIVPVFLLFLLVQRRLVSGLTAGAVK